MRVPSRAARFDLHGIHYSRNRQRFWLHRSSRHQVRFRCRMLAAGNNWATLQEPWQTGQASRRP